RYSQYASLQWSRRVHSAECIGRPNAPTNRVVASMEPPSSLGGMNSPLQEICPGGSGFNGAAEFTRRNADARCKLTQSVTFASMEPPSSLGGMDPECGVP